MNTKRWVDNKRRYKAEALRLGIQHCGLGHYKVYSNDDPVLTLTYFTAMSNCLIYAFVREHAYIIDFKETIK